MRDRRDHRAASGARLRRGVLIAVSFFATWWAQAAEPGAVPAGTRALVFQSQGVASDLICPPWPSAKRVPPPSTEEAPLAPPEPDELGEILKNAGRPEASTEAPSSAPPEAMLAAVPRDRAPRIALWGDSHLAAHFFSEELIRLSGLPRAKVQPSLIPPTMGRAGVRLPLRRSCVGPGWRWRSAHQSREPGGVMAPSLSQISSTTPGSYLWLDFRLGDDPVALRSLDLHLTATTGPVTLELSIDDEPAQRLRLDPATHPRLRLVAETGMSTLRLRLIEGELSLDGLVPVYQQEPALVLDTFGFPGATARGWTQLDAARIEHERQAFAPDLAVIAYGTNEGNDRNFDPGAYTTQLREAVATLRQLAPHAQCVLVGPTDRGVLVRRASRKAGARKLRAPVPDLLRYANIHRRIAQIQAVVAAEKGCLFWDWQAAMGGPGGAYRWHYRSPRLMAPDLLHLSVQGYQQSARLFAAQLRLADWLTGAAPR